MEYVTKRMRARCTCPKGHEFSATYLFAVDIDAQPEALETLTEGGMQLVRCPECGTVWPIAHTLSIHQPERKRIAVFVPEVLAHHAYELKAKEMMSLGSADPDEVPPYAYDFEVIVGIDALQVWLFGRREPVSEGEKRITQIPRIHEAFADLHEPERPSSPPSVIPDAPGLDDLDDEPMYDDEWLGADMLRSSVKRVKSKETPSRPPPEKKVVENDVEEGRPTVDFAGLLTEDDDEDAVEDILGEDDGEK